MIKKLKKDIKATTTHPDFDNDDRLRAEEAYLENKILHMIKVQTCNQKTEMKANLAMHGKKLGGIWTAINKEKKPCNLICRLKIPESTPYQYERKSPKMAELARNYHNRLQQQNIND